MIPFHFTEKILMVRDSGERELAVLYIRIESHCIP